MFEFKDNPHLIKAENFSDKLRKCGFVTFEGPEDNDDFDYGFEFCDLSKVPLKLRIEFYNIEIDRIVYDILNNIETNEQEDLYHNCKMLYLHTIRLIKEEYC